MQSGSPSRTAVAAARHRAAHQVLEGGRIFADPLAVTILGESADEVARRAEERPSERVLRLFIAARTRFAEDALADAVERGVRQLVVLGAGLDTYAYRGALRERLHIFEVDHPDTQAWKRARLAEGAIALPDWLTFAPIDFERQTLPDGLAAAGFDAVQPAFFTWLGVVPYLTADAIWSTLGFIAGLTQGAQVVFDYANPPDSLAPEMRAVHDERAARVAEIGESWISYFESDALHAKLTGLGFSGIEDLGPHDIVTRYINRLATSLPRTGAHILRAGRV
ncbi:MAG TPA: SAM-dependent methyltransferase [Bryobacteraceae bacterium]|nr:SAM-dependent methyltransferase [Bryobacteraceae bacterium]